MTIEITFIITRVCVPGFFSFFELIGIKNRLRQSHYDIQHSFTIIVIIIIIIITTFIIITTIIIIIVVVINNIIVSVAVSLEPVSQIASDVWS